MFSGGLGRRGRARGRGVGRPPRRLPGQRQRVWQPANMEQPVVPPFTTVPSLQVDAAGFVEHDFVELYLDRALFTLLVNQTNLFAEQWLQRTGAALCHVS